MAKYLDSNGNVSLIENPDLNQGLIAGKTLVPDTTPLGRINSSALSAPVNYNFQQPNQTPIYPVSAISDGLTNQEQKKVGLLDQLQEINNQLVGESTDRAALNQQYGINDIKATQDDLAAQLGGLIKESKAIPLQLQQESKGRGITAGGLRPLETAALRNNAIQSLSVAAQFEASQGRLASAQRYADEAIKQKYEPLKERAAAITRNLEIIANDPRTSLEDRQRALAQKAIEDQKAAAAKKQEETESAKFKLVLEYAGLADALTLRNMQAAPDAAAVLQIAAQKGLVTPEQAKAKLNEELIRSQIEENKARASELRSQIQERNNAPGGIQTLTGKPQNATQATANGYADRLNEASITIDSIGKMFTGNLAFGNYLPNMLQSGNRQAYEQAKRNFVTAVLRRESGASISPTEFETAEKLYFPQAGDTPSTVAKKEVTRNTVINNFYREANVARPVLPGMTIESNGKKYRVGPDGVTLTEI